MDVSQWTAMDETASQVLLRLLRGKLPLLKSFVPLYQVSLHSGDVLEVAGPSGSAKSELLLQMAVECILPKEHDGVVYGGCDSAVVWFDLDCRFDQLRFLHVVRSRLGFTAEVAEDKDRLYTACLKRFNYIRCYNSIEFLAALKTFGPQLKRITQDHKNGVQLFVIDSIGAFYWLDRASQCTPYSADDNRRCSLSLQVVSVAVVRELRKLLQLNRMLVVATKAFLSIGSVDGQGKQICKTTGRFSNREFMSAAWQEFVTHRLLLHGPYRPESPNLKSRDVPVFFAQWDKPATDVVDVLLVQDDGMILIN